MGRRLTEKRRPVIVYFLALFLYLEMSEQGGWTQGLGRYRRKAYRWMLRIWNGEIHLIIGLPLGFSVANAGAGAKNGHFWGQIGEFL